MAPLASLVMSPFLGKSIVTVEKTAIGKSAIQEVYAA